MRSNSIPKGMLAIYERIVGLTDDVCERQLNSEYRDLVSESESEWLYSIVDTLRKGQANLLMRSCTEAM